MMMTVAELRQVVNTEETDQALEARLLALELLIRAYTNNNFQARAFRTAAAAVSTGKILLVETGGLFKAGDTLQITDSALNAGLVNVRTSSGRTVTVKEELYDEAGITVTKVVYPEDVKRGAAAMLKWQLDKGDKAGVQSETLSRHSVTYYNMDGDNSIMGYPSSLRGFLTPYMQARFGQGAGV